MPKETPEAKDQRRKDQQTTAYLLAKYMVDSRADRKAIIQFSQVSEPNILRRRGMKKTAREYLRRVDANQKTIQTTLTQNQITILTSLRTEKRTQEEKDLENKRDKGYFTVRDRTIIAIRAVYNRMPKEKKIDMFTTAGYKPGEMPVDLSKRAWQSGALSLGVLALEEGIRGIVATNDTITSFFNQIPENFQSVGAALSILAYTGSYGAYVYQNLRLAKRFGRSANPAATTFDATAKHLFKDRASDMLAVGTFTGIDALWRTTLANTLIGGLGGSERVIATNTTLTLINLALVAGAEVMIRSARKKKENQGS